MKYNLIKNTFTFNQTYKINKMKLIKSASIVIIILLAIIISSCKKNDNTSPDSSGGNGTTQIANNAVFLSRKQAMITNTSVVSSGNFSTAFISTSALVNNGPIVGTLLTMGDVSLNGTTFQKNAYSVSNYYADSTSTVFNTPHNWIISGSSAVNSFSYSNTNSYPVYTGYTAIADSFNIANNVTIPLINYSGSDEIETYFVTSTNPVTKTSTQNISGSPSVLNFTSTDLSTIGVNPNVTLVITFYKNNLQTINGNSVNFRTGYTLFKSNIKFK